MRGRCDDPANSRYPPTVLRARLAVLAVAVLAAGATTPLPAHAAGGSLSFSTTSLLFGNTRVGAQSVRTTITVTNNGGVDVAVSSIKLDGAHPKDFFGSTTCVQTLVPNETCTIGVVSAPTAEGTRSATVSVVSDAATSPTATATGAGTVGYYLAGLYGETMGFGDAPELGDVTHLSLAAPIIDIATTQTDGGGFWLLGMDGGIFSFGNAAFKGSTGGMPLNQPVIGLAPHPKQGYWFVALDGGVFAFGDAGFHGSMGGTPLNQPVVAMAGTPTGNGYWLVATDGGVFAFGDAGFHGSMGGTPLNQPIVGIAPTPSGKGYWMVASDGGIFGFGDAGFHGSMGGTPLNSPVVDIWPTPTGRGYWMAAADGGIFRFGDAAFKGSLGGQTATAIAIAGTGPGVDPARSPDGSTGRGIIKSE